MRYRPASFEKWLKEETLKAIRAVATDLKGKDAVYDFLTSTLTESELLMLGRRLLIARLLLEGVTHLEIRNRLHVSPNTVWHVSRWLQEKIPEYGAVLETVTSESKAKRDARKVKRRKEGVNPLSFTALKHKYPMHFLLFNLADEFVNSFKKQN